MKTLFLFVAFAAVSILSSGKGLNTGDSAPDFKLKNVDGKYLSLSDYSEAKGFIVVFTCNTCPYAKAYQDRINDLDKEFKKQGVPVIAINPNDPDVSPGDSFDSMVDRAEQKNYSFPYLFDEKQEVFPAYGATKTPHVYLLKKKGDDYIVTYIGAIDDNYKDASQVNKTYLADAVNNMLAGKNPDPANTKAIGCGIKVK
ncbi:MAG: thioredoxin family protein [Bacteroidales bacterium]|nr:thioredoxin family protein [Bacteroidales bacterium]